MSEAYNNVMALSSHPLTAQKKEETDNLVLPAVAVERIMKKGCSSKVREEINALFLVRFKKLSLHFHTFHIAADGSSFRS